eukprot:858373-Pleurochrysis_carterae.AAC.4
MDAGGCFCASVDNTNEHVSVRTKTYGYRSEDTQEMGACKRLSRTRYLRARRCTLRLRVSASTHIRNVYLVIIQKSEATLEQLNTG